MWIASYFTVFIMLKSSFQNISKTLSKNLFKLCHNWGNYAGTNSLKRFLEKTPGTEKHKDKQKTSWRRYVAMATPIAIKPRSLEIFIFI